MEPTMPRTRYPLEPLARVRAEKVDVAATGLAKAIVAREGAERARVEAEAERARQDALAKQVRDAEAGALASGALLAADLQRQGAWDARMRWEDEERARKVADARGAEVHARSEERGARTAVATAEAEAKVVSNHKDRWTKERDRALEAADEEGAAEAWRSRT